MDPVVCGRCGRTAEEPPLSWSRNGTGWLCDTCTREHVRDIEARLDESWW
jgi:transposase